MDIITDPLSEAVGLVTTFNGDKIQKTVTFAEVMKDAMDVPPMIEGTLYTRARTVYILQTEYL